MIHEILSSDVDFAKGLIDSGHSDPEILASLASRGLDPAQAAQLLDDLRHDRKPSANLPFDFRPANPGAVRTRDVAREESHRAPPARRHRSRRGKHKRSGIPWWFIVLVCVAVFALGYVLVQTGRGISVDTKHEIPPPPGKQ